MALFPLPWPRPGHWAKQGVLGISSRVVQGGGPAASDGRSSLASSSQRYPTGPEPKVHPGDADGIQAAAAASRAVMYSLIQAGLCIARRGRNPRSADRRAPASLKMESNLKRTKRKRKRICLFGHFGKFNSGNDSSLLAILYNVRRFYPEAEVVCICDGPEAVAATHKIEAVPISSAVFKLRNPRNRVARLLRRVLIGAPSELWRYFRAFKTLKGADMLIIPGTGLLTDAYGLHNWGPYSVFKWSLTAKLRRCKLLFVSVGAGPIYSPLGRWLVRAALALADFRSYRDEPSMKCVEGIGLCTKHDPVYPDLVFSLPETMVPHNENRGERKR